MRTTNGRSSSSLRSSLWDDLAPPFSSLEDDRTMELPSQPVQNPDVTHFLFLVHGHRGLSKDLSYLQTIMQLQGERKKQQGGDENDDDSLVHDMVVHNAVCNEQKTYDGVEKGGERLVDEMVSVIREEMEKRMDDDPREGEQQAPYQLLHNVTISVVGNSLGGIYSRFAIARLAEQCVSEEDGSLVLDGKYRLQYNIFCTTASPHLGVSQHTWLPLPRAAEIRVAKALGTTGHDLFRLNDLMKTMATDPKFLEPLGSFRKRIAYANAYGTDFPVPPETAAFLSHNSSYPHHFVEESGEEEDDRLVVDDNGLVIATLHTPPSADEVVLDDEHADELVQMSRALDSLGWKKVFVDLSGEIPIGVSLPKFARRSSSQSSSRTKSEASSIREADNENNEESHKKKKRGSLKRSILKRLSWKDQSSSSSLSKDHSSLDASTASSSDNNDIGEGSTTPGRKRKNSFSRFSWKGPLFVADDDEEEEEEASPPIHLLKQKGVVESRDVVSAVSNHPTDNRISLPIGHNMICAFSRGRISSFINKGGRPVVDSLARELVDDIFTWKDNTRQG